MVRNLKQIFSLIIYAAVTFVPAGTDCPEHIYNLDPFTLPSAPNSSEWIPSDCLDEKKLLIFRRCLNDEWTPSNNEFDMLCRYRNGELINKDCPFYLVPIETQAPHTKTICLKGTISSTFVTDTTRCMLGSLSIMEINIDEEVVLIEKIKQFGNSRQSLSARNMWPNKVLSETVNGSETVELQDVRCGRFGLPFKIEENVPIYCQHDECDNLCLSMNFNLEPSFIAIEECTHYMIDLFKNVFIHRFGCPNGYYRIQSPDFGPTYPEACFSIQMFTKPIPVKNIDKANIIQTYCNGTIMPLIWEDDLFVFRQLTEQVGLTDEHDCLFGLRTNRIIEYSEWNLIDVSQIHLGINWDKKMNYSRISNNDEVSYLAMKPNGQWTWAVDTVSCIVCMLDIPTPNVELRLNYNLSERKLEFEATHQDFLYREKDSDPGFICFALIGEIYKANLTIFPIANSIGKYIIENVGNGQYWCSGHHVKHGVPKFHKTDIIYTYGAKFAFLVEANSFEYFYYYNQLLDDFKENNEFVRVVISDVVEYGTIESKYVFTAHLRLTLQDDSLIMLDSNFVNLKDYQIETVFIYERLNPIPLSNVSYDNYNIQAIRSTEYCLHDSTLSMDAIIWGIANLGETITPSLLCRHSQNNLKVTQTCSGDSIHGAFWEELVDVTDCYTFISESLLELYVNISNPNQTTQVIQNLAHILQENVPKLLPIDVFLASRILQKVNVKNRTFDDLKNVLSIYNSLMLIDVNFLKISSFYNSTNILLTAFDNVLLDHIESSKYENFTIHSPLIETFTFDTIVSDISGIALYRPRFPDASDDNFETYSVRYIYSNETIDDLLGQISDKYLVIGSYIPSEMRNRLKNSSIVMTVFFNDKLFQSTEATSGTPEKQYFETNGKIISISIVGSNDNFNLPDKIPIFFHSNRNQDSKCGHWSFRQNEGWSSNGCSLRDIFSNNLQWLSVCNCSYFTYYGNLINTDNFDKHNPYKLKIITIFGPLLAVFVIGVAIVVWLFRNEIKNLFRNSI